MNFIIEGVDRLGKGTLIGLIQEKFGYHTVIHYEKPKALEYYNDPTFGGIMHTLPPLGKYQYISFSRGFDMLRCCDGLIFDRFHLGEVLYAPRYRGYSGDYVFELENQFTSSMDSWAKGYSRNVKLILLTTSDFSFIQDDGLSFDFSAKESEQEDFIAAFERSTMPNKVMIDVCNGNGGFKTPDQIFQEAMA